MFIKKLIKQSVGEKMFSVSFVKANNTERTMLCKLPTAEKFLVVENFLEIVSIYWK